MLKMDHGSEFELLTDVAAAVNISRGESCATHAMLPGFPAHLKMT